MDTPPEGSEFTTSEVYDPRVKARAYDLFLNTDLNVTDIAVDIGVARATVASWVRAGNWRLEKQKIEDELMRGAEDKYRRLIIANRGPVVERHLRISEKLEEAIEKVIDEATRDDGVPSDMKLKRLAEALASVTGISARAAAVSDKPFSNGQDQGDKPQRRPLVMIGVQVQAPPGAEAKVNVTEAQDE